MRRSATRLPRLPIGPLLFTDMGATLLATFLSETRAATRSWYLGNYRQDQSIDGSGFGHRAAWGGLGEPGCEQGDGAEEHI
jgi:hypothetical protein